MSWKRILEAIRSEPVSLASRLSAWYAGSAFVLLLIVIGFLYWTLVRSFDRENDQYLAEKLTILQTLLRDRTGQLATVQWEVEGESQARPSLRVLSRVLSETGQVVNETSGMSRELPQKLLADAALSHSEVPRAIEVRSADGRTFRALAAQVSTTSLPSKYTVQVAVDLTYQQDLLADYRHQLWLVLSIGLFLSIVVGHRIARRGLRPLREIAGAIGRTRSTTLDERVSLTGLPSELRDVASTFNEMLDRLGDSFSRLSRFSSDIAHELRTPLNNLLGEVEVALTKTRSPQEYSELLGSLSEECQQLSRLIDSLLFLARAEHPETQIHRDDVDVFRELSIVREFYEAAASDAGVRLELRTEGTVHARLDRTLLQRAVGNLVQNAIAHTPAGGDVMLTAHSDPTGVVVSVADSGIGITPDHLSHVFERFYRVDPARSKHTGGVGLGLAIVQSIAKLHEGRIEMESVPGKGTRASLIFPNDDSLGVNGRSTS